MSKTDCFQNGLPLQEQGTSLIMVDKPDMASPDRLTTTSADSSGTPLRGMRGRDLGLLPTSAALSMSLSLAYLFWRMRCVLVA